MKFLAGFKKKIVTSFIIAIFIYGPLVALFMGLKDANFHDPTGTIAVQIVFGMLMMTVMGPILLIIDPEQGGLSILHTHGDWSMYISLLVVFAIILTLRIAVDAYQSKLSAKRKS